MERSDHCGADLCLFAVGRGAHLRYVRGHAPAADAEGAGFLRGRYLAAVYTIAMVLCVTLLALYGRIMGRSARLTFRAPGWASPIRLLSGYLLLWCFSIAVEPLASMLPGRDGDMGTGGWFLLCSIVVAPLFEEIIFRGFLTGGMLPRLRRRGRMGYAPP